MELFNTDNLDGAYDVFVSKTKGAQRIYALVNNNSNFNNPTLSSDDLTRALEDPWESDIDGDYQLQPYSFTRQPLVIEGVTGDNDTKLVILSI